MGQERQQQQRPGGSTGVSDEAVFKVAKEIVVKFIEVGRLTPAEFDETFRQVYASIERTVRGQ
ncbi:MAG: hypothetical protein CSA21_03050 [Deltaproteobacteria bacterium]|nr:MAG: hypothetical protein CSA21_03050 [Deltaproteobacteria bacterium]